MVPVPLESPFRIPLLIPVAAVRMMGVLEDKVSSQPLASGLRKVPSGRSEPHPLPEMVPTDPATCSNPGLKCEPDNSPSMLEALCEREDVLPGKHRATS